MKSRRIILLAAGGTGGHIYPSSAVAAALKENDYAVHWATDKRGLAYRHKIEKMPIHKLAAATIYGTGILALPTRFLTLAYAMMQAFILIVRLRPAVIIGFGGYPSFAPIMMGLLLRRKILIHEQNAVLGRVNRLAARLGAHVATSFTDTLNMPDKARHRLRKTGNPLRWQVLEAAHAAYPFAGDNQPFELLVFGGSQGAHKLDQIMPQAIGLLDAGLKRRLRVVQQVQRGNMSRLLHDYNEMRVYVELRDFFDDLPTRMRRAHLAICRGGASTISELAALGVPSIIVPLPAALDQDQARNAKTLSEEGGCLVMPQDELSAETLAKTLSNLLINGDKLKNLSARAREFATLKATDQLARYALCLAENRKIDIERVFARDETQQEDAQ